jgi:RecB family endonuclease NucS
MAEIPRNGRDNMSNLFWKAKTGIKALLETPFRSEEEFEKTVFTTSELLADVTLIKRQVRGGAKVGIPDIIGIDSDGSVCILTEKTGQATLILNPCLSLRYRKNP